MAQDLEHFLKELFGEPLSRLNKLQSDQMERLMKKLHEIAREAVKEDIARLHTEVAELRARLAVLENERAQAAAEAVQPSF
jgi:polyhydroxyalkanoate synthesis regulator phasin